MAVSSFASFVSFLKASPVLEPWQLELLNQELEQGSPDSETLAEDLIRRGWLTPFQVELLREGRGQELTLGAYVLLDRLGAGGMGEVFKARHRRLDRIVALKVIRKERLPGPEAVLRIQREARLAARLTHPNVVLVYDADQVGDTFFFTMEYVEGWTLAQLVANQGPLPVGLACEAIRQAALGLQHAHSHGLVHRDVKPSNLVLAHDTAVVKVLDLGLACLAPELKNAEEPLTDFGVAMGTADYMAPEQAIDARRVDIRADVYSLGCSLYCLLAGRPPFAGGSTAQKLLRHQQDTPAALESVRPQVEAGLGDVVRRMMARTPEQRFQTPAEAATALEPFSQPDALGLLALTTGPARAGALARASDLKYRSPETSGSVQPPTRPLPVPVVSPSRKLQNARGRQLAFLLLVVALAALAVCFLLWSAWRRAGSQSPSLPVLIVGRPTGAEERSYPTLRAALAVARPGDRILVRLEELEERLQLQGGDLGQGVTIQGAASSGRPVVWHVALAEGQTLIQLHGVAGLCLKGFVLDGQERADDLVTISGACPGLTLEDLHLRGFRRSAVHVHNCQGTADQPVTLRRLRTTTEGNARTGLLFDSQPDPVAQVVGHVRVEDCRLEGPCSSLIEVAAPLLDVHFRSNRLFQAGDGLLYRSQKVSPRHPVEWTVEANTFCAIRNAALHFEGLPLAEKTSRVVVRNNLFAKTAVLAQADELWPESLSQAKWLCDGADQAALRCFRRHWQHPLGKVSHATMTIYSPDEYRLWLNGSPVGGSPLRGLQKSIDVTAFMGEPSGQRTFVWGVECRGPEGVRGFAALLAYDNDRKEKKPMTSDAGWVVFKSPPPPDWLEKNLAGINDQTKYPRAQAIDVAGLAPHASGNVRDQTATEGNLPLAARKMDFLPLPENRGEDAAFLRYPKTSPLSRAGREDQPVGVPPSP